MPSPPFKMKVLLILEENSYKTETKAVRYLPRKLELLPDILWAIVGFESLQ